MYTAYPLLSLHLSFPYRSSLRGWVGFSTSRCPGLHFKPVFPFHISSPPLSTTTLPSPILALTRTSSSSSELRASYKPSHPRHYHSPSPSSHHNSLVPTSHSVSAPSVSPGLVLVSRLVFARRLLVSVFCVSCGSLHCLSFILSIHDSDKKVEESREDIRGGK